MLFSALYGEKLHRRSLSIALEGNLKCGITSIMEFLLTDVNWMDQCDLFILNNPFDILVEHPDWIPHSPIVRQGVRHCPKDLEWERINVDNKVPAGDKVYERSVLFRRKVMWPFMDNYFMGGDYSTFNPPSHAPYLVPLKGLFYVEGIPDVMLYMKSDPEVCAQRLHLSPSEVVRCVFTQNRYEELYSEFAGPKFCLDTRDTCMAQVFERVALVLALVRRLNMQSVSA